MKADQSLHNVFCGTGGPDLKKICRREGAAKDMLPGCIVGNAGS